MANSNELIIKIGAESKQFQDELDKIRKKTEDFESQLATVAKISGTAFAGLTASLGLSVKAFASVEASTIKLSNAMKTQGVFTKQLLDSYNEQADALERLTGVDDAVIREGLALTQSFIGQKEVSEEYTKAVLDLAEGLNIDVSSAFQMAAKVVGGSSESLARYKLKISETATEQERMAAVIKFSNDRFKDQAASTTQGLGSFKLLQVAIENLAENIGEKLAPVVTEVVQRITKFFNAINDNKPLVDLIARLGVAAAAFTGVIFAISTGLIVWSQFSTALIAVKAAMSALGVASIGVLGPIGLIAAGLAAATAAFLIFKNSQETSKLTLQDTNILITAQRKELELLEEKYKKTHRFDVMIEVEEAKKKLDELEAHAKSKNVEINNLETQKKAANELAAQKKADQTAEKEAQQAHQDELLVQQMGYSQKTIELQKQEAELLKQSRDVKNAAIKEDLILQAEEVRALKEEQMLLDEEQAGIFQEQILARNEEYQAMSEEQQAQFREKNRLELQKDIQTRETTEQLAAQNRAKLQIESNNRYLLEQQKFGTAYATINQAMHSAVYQGSKTAFSELAQLTQSSNSTLKGIGKVAALAMIVIKTAESAMNIYAGFSTIPIVGPALGIAGAAAAVAFGAEQFQKVQSAADGGVITGGVAGRDSVPALLMPGELVVPTRNFSEVVNAVANARAQSNPEATSGISQGQGSMGQASQMVAVEISLAGEEAEKLLTARQVEARALGTLREETS